jgi:hypothetical protein
VICRPQQAVHRTHSTHARRLLIALPTEWHFAAYLQ